MMFELGELYDISSYFFDGYNERDTVVAVYLGEGEEIIIYTGYNINNTKEKSLLRPTGIKEQIFLYDGKILKMNYHGFTFKSIKKLELI